MKNRLLPGLDLEVGDTIFFPEFIDRSFGNYFPSLVLSIRGPYENISMGKSDGKYIGLIVATENGVERQILHECYARKFLIR